MISKIFKKIDFLKKFDNKDIKSIEKIGILKKYPKNYLIFNKNDIGKHFFVVKSGKVKIFSKIGNKTKTITLIEKNDFFGEMSLLGCENRSASAITMEDSEIYLISKANFDKYLIKNPKITLKLLYSLSDRLNRADREIENMLFHNLLGRLANTILDILKNQNSDNHLKLTQTEIASYMGTTRVPVCRAINLLKKRKVIYYSNGILKILDFNKLKSLAGK